MGRISNWFSQMFNWVMGSAEDTIPDSTKLDSEARKMLAALEKQKDATTSQMALASEARDKLEEEVARNEALKDQAKRFKSDGNEEMLYRVMDMKLKSDDRIKELQKHYETLREASRQAITTYKVREKEVMEKVEKLEMLKEQARINQIREEVQQTQQRFDLTAPSENFDRLADKIGRKSSQLDAGSLLADSDNKMAEFQVKAAMQDQRLLDAVKDLEVEIDQEKNVIEGEYSEVKDAASDDARKLLSEPTFGDLLSPVSNRKKEPVK